MDENLNPNSVIIDYDKYKKLLKKADFVEDVINKAIKNKTHVIIFAEDQKKERIYSLIPIETLEQKEGVFFKKL